MTERPRRAADRWDPPVVVDLMPDELALARAQLASGLFGLAEGVLLRLIAGLEAAGKGGMEELDAARALLAEALWRQGRPLAAGAAVQTIRSASLERRRPIIMLIEAEALAASGDPDRAARLAERVVSSIGVDEAWKLRGGVATRITWPAPSSFRSSRRADASAPGAVPPAGPTPERIAAAHGRLEAARVAFAAGELDEGDRQLAAALRLDPRVGQDAVSVLEATLEEEPSADRLLLYGDLLRAAGREAEATAAFDRAARA
jgi:tetratricopeptide (TPR) repeat protein